jgi:putative nucleotidyltransferase with HDIG domain
MEKIHVNQLKVGMTVVKTDKKWYSLPFLNKPIKDEKTINIIKNFNIEYVYVLKGESHLKEVEKDNINEADFKLDDEDILKHTVTLSELNEAKMFYEKAKSIIKFIFEEAKKNHKLDIEPAKELIGSISTKFFKKPHILTGMAKLKNFEEYDLAHSVNVSVLCLALGKKLGYDGERMQHLGLGGLLHDIGKIKISNDIIHKKGALSEEEYEIVKKHPEYGYEMVEEDFRIPQQVKEIILQHHERFDGTGYPYGLKDFQISQHGQIAAIADVYDAMTSDKLYNKRKVHLDALKTIHKLSGKHFSKTFVKFFVDVIGIYPVGTLVLLDTDELGIVFEKNSLDPTLPKVIIVANKNKEKVKPYIFDLSKYNLITKKFYKKIIAPLDAKEFDINTNAVIEEFIRFGKRD